MPLYRVSWRQAHDNTFINRRKWSNVLYLFAATSVEAAAAGVVGWNILRAGQTNNVFCYEVNATDLTAGTDDFTTQAVPAANQRGSAPPNSGERYLPKVCMAVTLLVPGSRPSRKFWRVDLHETDISEGVTLNPALVTTVTNAWNNFISIGDGQWVDPDGQELAGVGTVRLTTRQFGRESAVDVPAPPVG